MVRVVVRQKDLAKLDQTDIRAQELPLSALCAVEEQALSAATQQQRGRRPLCGWHRPGGSEKDKVEIHAV